MPDVASTRCQIAAVAAASFALRENSATGCLCISIPSRLRFLNFGPRQLGTLRASAPADLFGIFLSICVDESLFNFRSYARPQSLDLIEVAA